MATFTERIGVDAPRTVLQIESMNAELRNSLWNVQHDFYHWGFWGPVANAIARFHLRLPIDELPDTPGDSQDWVKAKFFGLAWGPAYNYIEFLNKLHTIHGMVADEGSRSREPSAAEFRQAINYVLEREMSAYRFVGTELAPIADKSEVAAIEEAQLAARSSGMAGAETHLKASVRMLGLRPNPDYRNAVKEAISAVESVAKQLANSDKATLDAALKALSAKSDIHPALQAGFSKIYGYTNDADGIRHAMLDEATVDFAEAKYMVVSCSAFVHYLIQKGAAAALIK